MDNKDIKNRKVRVRFAPSPTGFLHIGSLRTALFNWLFARHNQGSFLVRVEDTDRDRFSKEHEQAIVQSLQWSGIQSDEPFVYQHDRRKEHQKAADLLIEQGKAYYCFCLQDDLQLKREKAEQNKQTYVYDQTCRNLTVSQDDLKKTSVIRFKVECEDDVVQFNDLIRGEVSLPLDHIDDFIIARSDGSMTYNFAVVQDDKFMKISHIIRGEDHIVNTGKQILLFKAFGYEIPQFAHVPLILSESGQKMSKRDDAVGVQDYRSKGILAEALSNYLVRLGWSHGDQEVFTTDELIQYFKIDDVGKKGAIFDYQKLLWLNSVYIKEKSAVELFSLIQQNLNINLVAQLSDWSQEQQQKAIMLYKDRSHTLHDLINGVLQLYNAPETYDVDSLNKWVDQQTPNVLSLFQKKLEDVDFNKDQLQALAKTIAKEQNVKFPKVAQPMRIALIGSSQGPGVFDMVEIIGKEAFFERLNRFSQSL